MGEKGTLISKQQLFDEFLIGFCAREEMLKVEETAVCSETDVDAAWQIVYCFTEHDAEEDEEQCGGQNASLLDAVGYGDFPQSITADSIKVLGQVYESCI